jgi:hypothetical protein
MKLLAGASLLSLVLALAWVLLLQVDQAERALEPGARLSETETSSSPELSPIQGADNAVAAQSVSHLLDTLELDYLSANNQMTEEQMLTSLRASGQEVGLKVKVKAVAGGPGALIFRPLGPSRLALCDQATGNWHCLAEDLSTHQRRQAYGGSLTGAVKAARALLGPSS